MAEPGVARKGRGREGYMHVPPPAARKFFTEGRYLSVSLENPTRTPDGSRTGEEWIF